ncbi:MAG: restriction endonuclease [Methanomassiliicoccaceae archaeon]|nr:restriction endonuclease [Methanomassiliicoccaceae archaeon]
MRRRDVLTADVILGAVLIIIAFLAGLAQGMAVIITAVIARALIQTMVYNRHEDMRQQTLRRTVLSTDPLSFEILYVSVTAASAVMIWSASALLSVTILLSAMLIRLLLEYLWFSDRPDRWYSLRFRAYNMRRRFRPTYAERLQNVLVTEVDGMKGRDFEKYVAELLSMNGFVKVKVTRGSGDYGIDVTANLDRDRYAIQCKRSESKIGIKAVQEAFLGKEHYKADVAVVVTNNYFTKQAYEAAEGKVALWDRERLGNLLFKARDSLSDERYNEEMAASETEIRMFAALYDKGRGDARLTEKVMGTIYPAGDIRSEEDIDHFLRRVGEHMHKADGISELRLRRLRRALETDRSITPFEADTACYHLSGTHTITLKDMSAARSTLAKAFIDSEG